VPDLPQAGTVSAARLSVCCGAVLSVLQIGCNDSAGPGNVAGYYELTAVDSLAVPRMVLATNSCDELVLRGLLYLARNALFDLSVTQAQDCTRSGGTVDTFTTTKSGGFTVDGTRLVLHPSGTGIQLTGTTSSATVDLQLPQLPLLGAEARSGTFIIFPR
jgi:hypothetical protein